MRKAPRHVYKSINHALSGEKMNVPMPAPHTAIPVANARFSSKYIVTITIAGQYMSPKPRPA
jgi:hypothetical protein